MSQQGAPRILAVSYGGGHIAMMLPVLRALRQRVPGVRIDLLALTTAARVAREAGESPLGYVDLLPLLSPEEQAQALALARAQPPSPTHPDIPEAETVAYLGINAWDLQQQLGPEAAQTLMRDRGRHGFYPLTLFRRVIARLQPDLVLTTNSPRSEQAAADAAAESGLPSLAMLDLFGLPGDAFAARKRHPSRVCVLSQTVRDNLVRAGWPPERIAVTGNPAFDAINAPPTRAAGLAWRASMGAPPRRLVLLALQPEPATHPASPGRQGDPLLPERVLQACIDGVRPHPDWMLIVRPHPSQSLPALPDDPQLRLSTPAEPLHPLLHAVDAVITGTSTVALEAHLAGRRVLQLLDSIAAPAMPYLALGVADAACHLADLPQTLAALLAQPQPAPDHATAAHPAAGPSPSGPVPLPTSPTQWGRSDHSLPTRVEGWGGEGPLGGQRTTVSVVATHPAAGPSQGEPLPLPTSPMQWGRSDHSLLTRGEGWGGEGPLGGQRGTASVGVPDTAADRVAEQALALLDRSTPSPVPNP